MPIYKAFGLVISSEVPLRGMMQGNGAPDVTISYGSVPEQLPDIVHKGVTFQSSPGKFLLSIKNVGRFLVLDGKTIVVEPAIQTNDKDLGVFIAGSVIGSLLLQRDIYAFHGSALLHGNHAILISGKSGAGKSTLSSLLVQRGMALITDDLCALDCSNTDTPVVLPGTQQFKLWKDSIVQLGMNTEKFEKIREQMDKYYVPAILICNEPKPVKYVFSLQPAQLASLNIEEVKGFTKLALLKSNTYRYQYLRGMNKMPVHFNAMGCLGQHARIFKVARPQHGFHIMELADLIIQHLDKV
jgi:hypothetical protein